MSKKISGAMDVSIAPMEKMESIKFCVVQFSQPTQYSRLPLRVIVPVSWLHFRPTRVAYPREHPLATVGRASIEELPNPLWDKFPARCLFGCGTWEQAESFLKTLPQQGTNPARRAKTALDIKAKEKNSYQKFAATNETAARDKIINSRDENQAPINKQGTTKYPNIALIKRAETPKVSLIGHPNNLDKQSSNKLEEVKILNIASSKKNTTVKQQKTVLKPTYNTSERKSLENQRSKPNDNKNMSDKTCREGTSNEGKSLASTMIKTPNISNEGKTLASTMIKTPIISNEKSPLVTVTNGVFGKNINAEKAIKVSIELKTLGSDHEVKTQKDFKASFCGTTYGTVIHVFHTQVNEANGHSADNIVNDLTLSSEELTNNSMFVPKNKNRDKESSSSKKRHSISTPDRCDSKKGKFEASDRATSSNNGNNEQASQKKEENKKRSDQKISSPPQTDETDSLNHQNGESSADKNYNASAPTNKAKTPFIDIKERDNYQKPFNNVMKHEINKNILRHPTYKEGLKELVIGSGIYVNKDIKNKLKKVNTGTKWSSIILQEVFTNEFLQNFNINKINDFNIFDIIINAIQENYKEYRNSYLKRAIRNAFLKFKTEF